MRGIERARQIGQRLATYAGIVRSQKRPAKFLFGYALMRSGLSRLLTVEREGFRLRFHRSAIPFVLWVEAQDLSDDERFLRRYLRPGDTVVDVGANVGLLACAAAVTVGRSGRVVAVEPHPRVFRYLQENVALNELSQVECRGVAVGERAGEVRFSDLRQDNLNHIADGGTGPVVPCVRLDDLLPGDAPIALLKIDVEGYELEVLKGAPRTLDRVECVYIESWEEHLRQRGLTTEDVLGILRARGFQLLAPTRGDESTFAPVPVGHVSHRVENLVATRDPEAFLRQVGGRWAEADR